MLILGGPLPKSLVALKNCLGIEVVEGLTTPNRYREAIGLK